jgi:replicative DNA helicase
LSTVGRKLLSAIIGTGKVDDLFHLHLFPELFRDNELALYEFITGHVSQYGVIPSQDTVEGKLGDVIVEAPEPPDFYLDEVTRRFKHTKIKQSVLLVQEQLKANDPEEAEKLLSLLVTELYSSSHRRRMFDYRDAAEDIHAEYIKKHTGQDDLGVMFGWPSLDASSSGAMPGDFITINGRPAAGKTFAVLNVGLYDWQLGRSTPLLASMEMGSTVIRQRLAALDAKKNLTQVMKGILSSSAFKALMNTLDENKNRPNPYYVVDGNLSSTVTDLLQLCRQFKPTVCLVDGAYLLRHKNTRLSKWDRIAENAEMMKTHIAGDLGIPVIASYQLSRDVKKKKPDEEIGVEDIYGSDAMGQLSTLAVGFFEAENIETIKRRKCTIMKGRNGEVGEFFIHWNFNQMDFSEITETPKEEMQFLG